MPSPVVTFHCFPTDPATCDSPSNIGGAADHAEARLGVSSLDGLVHSLLERGVAQSTLASYNTGKRRYYNSSAFPPCPSVRWCFASLLPFYSLSLSVTNTPYVGMKHFPSIRSYLSAIRHLQITHGLPDPALASFTRLDYVLKGVRRTGLPRWRPNRLPITPEILRRIYQVWSREPRQLNRTMLWAAFCLGFFGFMRAGGSTLSRPKLIQSLHGALAAAGIDDSRFSGHSFQIGAVTTAARAGLSDSLIAVAPPAIADQPAVEGLDGVVCHLLDGGVADSTLRAYASEKKRCLSAVRHLQIASGLPDPALTPFARLDYVLKGTRRLGKPAPRPSHMPITPEVLYRIHQVWSRESPTFDRTMLWAAFALGFSS